MYEELGKIQDGLNDVLYMHLEQASARCSLTIDY